MNRLLNIDTGRRLLNFKKVTINSVRGQSVTWLFSSAECTDTFTLKAGNALATPNIAEVRG